MDIEEELTTLINPLVDSRLWWNSTPDGMTVAERKAPFVIAQRTGGQEGQYVDGSLQSLAYARIQFWVWSADYLDTARAVRMLRLAFTLISQDSSGFELLRSCELNGAPVDDYSEALKSHGKRLDVTFHYRDPDAPLP